MQKRKSTSPKTTERDRLFSEIETLNKERILSKEDAVRLYWLIADDGPIRAEQDKAANANILLNLSDASDSCLRDIIEFYKDNGKMRAKA